MQLVAWFLIGLLSSFAYLSQAQQAATSPRITDAYASSVFSGSGGKQEFDARRALQPGTGYWCSAGGLGADEQVTWTGTLSHAAHVKGVKIRWAYSPEEVQISTSADGENFHIAVPFKRTPSTDVSFDEDIFLEHPEQVKALTITMKKPIHSYFGINEVTLIGSGQPLLMLISGVTSPTGDMCLQVESGNYNKPSTEVVLESCASALAAGDGRELWRINDNQQLVSSRSSPPKCATLQDGNVEDGGKIVLIDCMRALEEADGRSNWNLEANSQLKLQKPGSYCLSQKNQGSSAAGLGDILSSGGATAKCSSNADGGHGAEMAVDGKVETFWASGGFEDSEEHQVDLDIDLGKPAKLSRIRIDWEYPAFNYEISTSMDGQSYVEQSANRANPSNATLDTLGGVEGQYIKVAMIQPHPRFGKHEKKYLYGIREMNVLSNRLQSIVSDCQQAANSDDARDKYFTQLVSEFDPVLAEKVQSMDNDLESRVRTLEESSKELELLFSEMDSCLAEKRGFKDRLHQSMHSSTNISVSLAQLMQLEPQADGSTALSQGDVFDLPAEDCYVIRRNDPNATSGFYWTEPQCAPEPLRMYCDMQSGTSVYIWNGNPLRKADTSIGGAVKSIEDIRKHCAEVGLEPLVLRSAQQLNSVYTSMKQLGYKLNGEGAVPLGFDYSCLQGRCSGSYHDILDGVTDQTSLLLSKSLGSSAPGPGAVNAAGLGFNDKKVSFFDLSMTDVIAIACSTNSLSDEPEMAHLDADCDTVAEENDGFAGLVNTNVVVECPPGCDEEGSSVLFGSRGVYSENSAICRAATHAGILNHGGLVNVAIESPRHCFEGSEQNGVRSQPLAKSKRTLRLGPVAKDCPIDMFEVAPTSFVEVLTTASSGAEPKSPARNEAALDPSVLELTKKVLEQIDEMHGVDPNIVVDAQEATSKTIAEARKRLKPAEVFGEKQGSDALAIVESTESLAERLFEVSGEFYSDLQTLDSNLASLETQEKEEGGFQSYKPDYNGALFSESWAVFDSVRSKHGPSLWGYDMSPTDGHGKTLTQASPVAGLRDGEGTFVMLKGYRFFDMTFTVNFFARGSGTVGILFRMRDFDNFYMLEMSQLKGVKRLVRVADGAREVLEEKADGGFIQGKWHTARIEATHGRLHICTGEAVSTPASTFSILDEQFLSGSIGFFSSNMRDGVAFGDISVKANNCKKFSMLAPPLPPKCAHFKDSYYGSFQSVYHQVNPVDSENSPGRWEHRSNVGGRPKVVAQLNSVRNSKEIGTLAILRGHQLCRDGFFSFDFFPECSAGAVIGAVFRYRSPAEYQVVEVTESEMRLQTVENGLATTIARIHSGFSANQWHSLKLHFDGPTVTATLNSIDGRKSVLRSEDIFGSETRDGRVGLSSYNCAGSAFDKVEVSPFDTNALNFEQMQVIEPRQLWKPCVEANHFLQRRDKCHRMLEKETKFRQVACVHDFCFECCSWHTSLLETSVGKECEHTCHQNDALVEGKSEAFLLVLNECLKVEGPANEHCSKDDAGCRLEFCHMCCDTNDSMSPQESAEFRAELEECKYQCGEKFSILG